MQYVIAGPVQVGGKRHKAVTALDLAQTLENQTGDADDRKATITPGTVGMDLSSPLTAPGKAVLYMARDATAGPRSRRS